MPQPQPQPHLLDVVAAVPALSQQLGADGMRRLAGASTASRRAAWTARGLDKPVDRAYVRAGAPALSPEIASTVQNVTLCRGATLDTPCPRALTLHIERLMDVQSARRARENMPALRAATIRIPVLTLEGTLRELTEAFRGVSLRTLPPCRMLPPCRRLK